MTVRGLTLFNDMVNWFNCSVKSFGGMRSARRMTRTGSTLETASALAGVTGPRRRIRSRAAVATADAGRSCPSPAGGTTAGSVASGGGLSGGRRVGIRDVARQADVSVATVSMVINANPKISRATAARVQRVMSDMGYRPNRLAQSLSSNYTRVLAAVLPPLRHIFADAYFGELLSGICDRAARLGHKIMLEHAKPEFLRERRHIELLERRYVDGLLLLGFNLRHRAIDELADRGYPAISVNSRFDNLAFDHVVCDYAGGAAQAMSCLLQMGHRRIGMIHATPEAPTIREVIEVYRSRLEQAGAAIDASRMHDGQFTEEGGAAAAEALMQRHPDLTAIFCVNDKMALGAMSWLQRRGIRVPQDVSVVGFDDIHHTAYVNPALTTVHLPLYECGARACERLVERVRGKTGEVRDVLPTHLVLRESTAIVPGSVAASPA